MPVARPKRLRELAGRSRTIGSDSVNFTQRKTITFGATPMTDYRPDEVIIPDRRWHWSNHMEQPISIPPALPLSRPSPLGAYTPFEDEYIGNPHGWPTWPKQM